MSYRGEKKISSDIQSKLFLYCYLNKIIIYLEKVPSSQIWIIHFTTNDDKIMTKTNLKGFPQIINTITAFR